VAGDSSQQTLERSEQLAENLKQLQQNNAFTKYSSISQWLPSIAMQKKSQALMLQAENDGLFNQLKTLLELPYTRNNPELTQLDFPTWQKSQIAHLFTDQWVEINSRYYSIIKLQGINDPKMLERTLNNYKDVVFVDKVLAVSEQVGLFRHHLVLIYIFALGAAMLVFCLRYGLLNAFIAVSRPAIAIVIALVISAWFFDSLSVFNYVAGILILALGLDYCVFYAEHGLCEKITLTTLISALSSLFVFAILIVSSTPAVSQFGFTVFIGVVMVFIMAPRLTLVSKRNI